MAATKLSDILVPEVWVPYFIERTAELSGLVQSGIVVADPELDILAARGGKLIDMPFFNDLTGDDEILSDTVPLSVDRITTGKDIARLQMRGKAWGATDLAKALSGADPLAAIADLVAAYWNRREQAILVASLKGLFLDNATNDAGDLIQANAITNGTPGAFAAANLIGSDAVIDAKTKLGDAAEKLSGIMMHSTPYSRLQKLNLIDMIPDSDGKIIIPTYLGLRVLVDDGCPVVQANGTTAANGYTYTTYLFGQGAIGRGEGNAPVPVETDRDSLQGEDYLINRRHFILHPRGIKWTETTCVGNAPTNVELATTANWDRVYEKKNIRIVALKTNG